MRPVRFLPVLFTVLLLGLGVMGWAGPVRLAGRGGEMLARLAASRLGPEVRIDGGVRLDLWPGPALRARRVRIAGPGGMVVTAREMRMPIGVAALLQGRLPPRDLMLQRAHVVLPWPPAPDSMPALPTGLRARIADGTLQLGGVSLKLRRAVLTGDAGAIAIQAVLRVAGADWRMGLHASPPDAAGTRLVRMAVTSPEASAPDDRGKSEAGPGGRGGAGGTGMGFSGWLGHAGLTGAVQGHGMNLARLMPAPSVPWRMHAHLRMRAGDLLLDDMAAEIGGTPVSGRVQAGDGSIRARIAAGSLDLDSWLAALPVEGAAWPVTLDLAAGSAALHGGMVRQLHALARLDAEGAQIRQVTARLPGDAALGFHGRVAPGDGTEWRLDGALSVQASQLTPLRHWLRPWAPALIDAMPDEAGHGVTVTGQVDLSPGLLRMRSLSASVDGTAVSGTLGLRLGAVPLLTGDLHLAALRLEPFLREGRVLHGGFAAALRLSADRVIWGGDAAEAVTASFRADSHGFDLAQLNGTVAGAAISISGRRDRAGRITGGRLSLAGDAARLAPRLAPHLAVLWPGLMALPDGLRQGTLIVSAQAAGARDALSARIAAQLDDARLEARPVIDPERGVAAGPVRFHDPNAARFLHRLAWDPAASWLQGGSLSLIGHMRAAPDQWSVDGLDLVAGNLRALVSGSVRFPAASAAGTVQGQVQVTSLPSGLPSGLPAGQPAGGSEGGASWPFRLLRPWRGDVVLDVAEPGGAPPPLLHMAVRLQGDAVQADPVVLRLGDGTLHGALTLDIPPDAPPHGRWQGAFDHARLQWMAADDAFGLRVGAATGPIWLEARGSGFATWLATLAGEMTLHLTDGRWIGPATDLACPQTDGKPPETRGDTTAGITGFEAGTVAVRLSQGVGRLAQTVLTTSAGPVAVSGAIDWPDQRLDIRLAAMLPHPEPNPAPHSGGATGGPSVIRLDGPFTKPCRILVGG